MNNRDIEIHIHRFEDKPYIRLKDMLNFLRDKDIIWDKEILKKMDILICDEIVILQTKSESETE